MNWREAARLGQQAFRDNQYRQAIAHHRKARQLALTEFEQAAGQEPEPAVAAVMVCEINLAESFVALEQWALCNACLESAERFLDHAAERLLDTGLEACLRGASFLKQERTLLQRAYPQLKQPKSPSNIRLLHCRTGADRSLLKADYH